MILGNLRGLPKFVQSQSNGSVLFYNISFVLYYYFLYYCFIFFFVCLAKMIYFSISINPLILMDADSLYLDECRLDFPTSVLENCFYFGKQYRP